MEKTTWLEHINGAQEFPSLAENVETEVVIIGGGLAGLLSAYTLSKAGKKVVVLEKKAYENSVTSYTTAFLTHVLDTALTDLREMFGDEKAKKLWQSHKDAIDSIEKIIKEENIDCEFVRVPEYMYANSESEFEDLAKEDTSIRSLGFEATLKKENSFVFKNIGSLLIPNQAKFHPLKFAVALKSVLKKNGVLIFENTEAIDITGDSPIIVDTQKGKQKGRVSAEYVITTTYQPFNNPRELFAHKGMYISYVNELEIASGLIPEGLYQDQKNPYHYFRVDSGESFDRMIIGGEDHRKEIPGMERKSFQALDDYTKEILGDTKYTLAKKWSGGILESVDGIAFIGRFSKNKPRQLVATGFSGNGMTYSMISADIFRDIILGKENPYKEIYNAGRKLKISNLMSKGLDYTAEFIEGALKNIFTK